VGELAALGNGHGMKLRPLLRVAPGVCVVGAGVLLATGAVGWAATRDLIRTPDNLLQAASKGPEIDAGQPAPEAVVLPPLVRIAGRSHGEGPKPLPTPPASPPPAKHVPQPPPAQPAKQNQPPPQQQKAAGPGASKGLERPQPKGAEARPQTDWHKDLGPKLPPEPAKDHPGGADKRSAETLPKAPARDAVPSPQETVRQQARAVEVKRQETSKHRLAEEKARLEEPSKREREKSHKQASEEPGARAAEGKHQRDDSSKRDDDAKHSRRDGRDGPSKSAHEETGHDRKGSERGKNDDDRGNGKHAREDDDSKQHGGRQDITRNGKGDDARSHHAERESAKDARQSRAEKRKEEREAREKKEQEEKDKKAAEAAAAKAAADAAAAKAVADAAAAKAAADAKAKAISAAKAQQSAATATAASTQSSVPSAQQTAMVQSTSQQNSDSRSSDSRSTDAKSADSTADASASQSTMQSGPSLSDSASKLGGPVQDNSSDVTSRGSGLSQGGGPGDRQKDRAAGKSDSRPAGLGRLLPPSPESYKPSELVATNPSPRLVSELESRGYSVEPLKSGGVRVKLPSGGLNAWDVRRGLEAEFPGIQVGLNNIYKPVLAQPSVNQYKPYDEATLSAPKPLDRSRTCTREVCYGPRLIGWDKSLASCAADLVVGVIDTRVDKNDPAFKPHGIEVIDVALKNDAKPAPHWHGTSVLSLLAGTPNGKTPGLIPDAEYKVANVFFTNAQGELETDTVHLTEALAELANRKVNVVNMSLVGPSDDLVHDRIAAMAAKGVVFVAAAGNGGPDALPGYPAAYREVIAVTAVNQAGASYERANRGNYIDAAAPGVGIWAALPKGDVALLSGTSFAAPFVTAVAAVAYRDTGLQEAAWGRGGLDPKQTMLMQMFGKDTQGGRDPVYGRGVVKAPAACTGKGWGSTVKVAPPPAPAPNPAPVQPVAQEDWQPNVQRASLLPSGASR
jgi:Subtilase family